MVILTLPVTESLGSGTHRKSLLNALLHRLFLDHDIIFYFLDNIEKIQEKFKPSFEHFQVHSISKASKGVIMG